MIEGRRFTDGDPVDGVAHYGFNADEFDAPWLPGPDAVTPAQAEEDVQRFAEEAQAASDMSDAMHVAGRGGEQ